MSDVVSLLVAVIGLLLSLPSVIHTSIELRRHHETDGRLIKLVYRAQLGGFAVLFLVVSVLGLAWRSGYFVGPHSLALDPEGGSISYWDFLAAKVRRVAIAEVAEPSLREQLLRSVQDGIDLKNQLAACSERVCVLPPVTAGIGQFINLGDGTFVDRASGLIWEASSSKRSVSPEESGERIASRNGDGRSGWVIPTIDQLEALFDRRYPARSVECAPDVKVYAAPTLHLFCHRILADSNYYNSARVFDFSTGEAQPWNQLKDTTVVRSLGVRDPR